MIEAEKEHSIGTSDDTKMKDEFKEMTKQQRKKLREDLCSAAIEQCFTNPGLFRFPVFHESMGQAYGYWQNYLLGKIPGTLQHKIPKVEIVPRNSEKMTEFTNKFKTEQSDEQQVLHDFFADKDRNILHFKAFRFDPKFCLLADVVDVEDIATTATTKYYHCNKLNMDLTLAQAKFYTHLKQLAYTALDRCEKYKSDEDKAVRNFAENWGEYLAAAIELEEHFQPIAEAVNNITGKLISGEAFPKFSIYRILVGIFYDIYYAPNVDKFMEHLGERLKELNEYTIRYYTFKIMQEECSKKQDYEAMKCFEDEKMITEFTKNLKKKSFNFKILVEYIRSVSEYVISMIDMHSNERNVHYAQSLCFLDILNGEDKSILDKVAKMVKDCFNEACKAIDEDERMRALKAEIIRELAYQYRILFPPSFLISADTKSNFLLDAEEKELNDKLMAAIEEHSMLEESESKEHQEPLEEGASSGKNNMEKDEKEAFDLTVERIKKLIEDPENAEEIAEFVCKAKPNIPATILYYRRRELMHDFVDVTIVNRNTEVRGALTQEIDRVYLMRGMPYEKLKDIK